MMPVIVDPNKPVVIHFDDLNTNPKRERGKMRGGCPNWPSLARRVSVKVNHYFLGVPRSP